MVIRKKKKEEEKGRTGKITNARFQTQEGPARKPAELDKSGAHALTAREIAEYQRKKKVSKKK